MKRNSIIIVCIVVIIFLFIWFGYYSSPKDVDSLSSQAIEAIKKGSYDDAIDDFTDAIKLKG